MCAFPECPNPVIDFKTNDIFSEVCHIVADSPDGPRGSVHMPDRERSHYANLILLCKHHHGVVDAPSSTYTVDELREMKKVQEDRAERNAKRGQPWQLKLQSLTYVNIPQIGIQRALKGMPYDTSALDTVSSLWSLGLPLARVLVDVERWISEVAPLAVDIEQIPADSNWDLTGLTLSFANQFRTKNGPSPEDVRRGMLLTGDLKRDPHIYCKVSGRRFVLPLDPRWITTTTAFVLFRHGMVRFGGLCTVKQVTNGGKEVIASPIVLGIPSNPFIEYLRSGSTKRTLE